MPTKSAVLAPNWGLYYNRTPLTLPPRAVQSGTNFRVKNGSLSNLNLGWEKFSDQWTLNGPVMLIDNFFPSGVDEKLIFATLTDIYEYDDAGDTVTYLTPIYATGTAAASGTAVTGTSTVWLTNAKAGDEISFGAADENDPDATWFVIDSVDTDTGITLESSAGTVADGVYTIRKLFTGTQANAWETDIFVNDGTSGDNLWFATNGLDDVVTWNGTDAQVTLHPELGFTCTTLKAFSNMMLYMNITDSGVARPIDIINSDIGEPLLAGDTGTGLSEQFKIHSGQDEILGSAILGDNLAIYSERHIVLTQFVGDPLVFIFRQVVENQGPLSPHAIASFGDYHEFVGADAQYRFDGVSAVEVNTHVWLNVIRQIDPIRRRRVYSHFDEENGDLIWVTPLTTDAEAGVITGDIEHAFTEHYLEDGEDTEHMPHSTRDFPFIATGYYERQAGLTWENATGTWEDYNYAWNDQFFSLAFPLNLGGDNDGQIYIIGDAQDADGTAMPSSVKFGRRPLGNGMDKNLLTRVYPFTPPFNGNLTVNVWTANHASGTGTLVGGFTFDMTLPEGGHFVSVFRAGRYADIGVSTTGNAWQLDGYDIQIRKGGSR